MESAVQGKILEEDGLRRTVEVTPTAAEWEKLRQAAIRRVGAQAQIPGFRPGKVPESVLCQRLAGEIGDAMAEGLRAWAKKAAVEAVGQPVSRLLAVYPVESGAMCVVLELFPTIVLPDWKNIALPPLPQGPVGEVALDRAFRRAVRRDAEQVAVDRPARVGDSVCISFVGYFADGVPLAKRFFFLHSPGKRDHIWLVAGDVEDGWPEGEKCEMGEMEEDGTATAPDAGAVNGDGGKENDPEEEEEEEEEWDEDALTFEEEEEGELDLAQVAILNALVGVVPGERKSVRVQFPPDHFRPELAGQEVTYDCEVWEVREFQVNGALWKRLGLAGADELREQLRKTLERERLEDAQERRREAVSFFLGRCPVPIPEAMRAKRAEEAVANFQAFMERIGGEPVVLRKSMANQMKRSAEQGLRREFILDEVARRESIVLKSEDLEKGVLRCAINREESPEAVWKDLQKNPNKLQQLTRDLLRDKILDRIIEWVEIPSCAGPEDLAPSAAN
ncbi:MAG: hypothetical protein LBT98_02690 [Puniceicoccales bacterium]|jgi:FKBP-type peptidyl-prolyl cis-trans isomerase (trigger factor)|nr:hypothetical protein [Puniceicoccales bacterium]